MEVQSTTESHKPWVKFSHWIVTLAFLALIVTGYEMIMVHPRFYWGEAGNDLTPALFELPVSRNYKHNGYTEPVAFDSSSSSLVTANRTYDIFNQNGWGRSLHFLAGWFLVIAGLVYFVFGFISGHFKRNIWLNKNEFKFQSWIVDFKNHVKLQIPKASGGPHYGVLQKTSYAVVVFVLMPLVILTGMTMSPAITAGYPFLLKLWGAQSARTIHFLCSTALFLFLVVHVVMLIKSGFKKQIRSMTVGE